MSCESSLREADARFVHWCHDLGLSLQEEQRQCFMEYVRILRKANRSLNLTRIVDPLDVYSKHFYDSLALCRIHDFTAGNQHVLDIGSGAGFPLFPLKIMFSHLWGTALEARCKKVDFLQILQAALRLSNITCRHGRAEDLAHFPALRETFSAVVARAVAVLPLLLEYMVPFVRLGGICFVMKGSLRSPEEQAGLRILHKLGGQRERVLSFSLPEGRGERVLWLVRKTSPTPPIYPRPARILAHLSQDWR